MRRTSQTPLPLLPLLLALAAATGKFELYQAQSCGYALRRSASERQYSTTDAAASTGTLSRLSQGRKRKG